MVAQTKLAVLLTRAVGEGEGRQAETRQQWAALSKSVALSLSLVYRPVSLAS